MNNFDYKNMTPFKWFVLENFPFIENDFDAINNYHLFSKVVEYLNKTIDNMNLTGEQIENVTNAMTELQNYVNNYFENLDVQEEINNKLDEMAQNGTLLEVITPYIQNEENARINADTNLQNQINVEKARIDNIVHLNEGSTTGDAELQDIRIGADGQQYDNAGNSIRGQINEIYNKKNIEQNVSTNKDVQIRLIYENHSINNQGVVSDTTNLKRATSQLIYVPNNCVISLFWNFNTNSNYKISLYSYNESKQFLNVLYDTAKGSYSTGRFYRICASKKDDSNITDEEINSILKVYINEIPQFANFNPFFLDGYINYQTGKYIKYLTDILKATNYFKVNEGATLRVLNTGNYEHNADLSGLAFYDENFNFISGFQYSDYEDNFQIEVPTKAFYCRASCYTNFTNNLLIYEIQQSNLEFNPINYKGNEICTFSNGIAIGDSLTQGVFNVNNGGTIQYIPIPKYSYPAHLTKMFGIPLTNLGIGGVTTKSWYETHENTDLSGYDFAIINLGANDTENNKVTIAETEQYLQLIVDKLKNENNNIKIFIASIIPAYYDRNVAWYEQINQTRKNVVNNNSNCYYIDLSLYSSCKNDTVYVAGHLTALGYRKEAEELKALISYIMSQNINDFKYIQFIGTNYSLN